MKFFLDTRNSETTGTAILSLGDEPGGNIIATLPYVSDVDKIRAKMFRLLPQAFDEIEGFRSLWFYHGSCTVECPHCKSVGITTKIEVPGASDAQVGRLERLRFKFLE